jgi:hypothetical protein
VRFWASCEFYNIYCFCLLMYSGVTAFCHDIDVGVLDASYWSFVESKCLLDLRL